MVIMDGRILVRAYAMVNRTYQIRILYHSVRIITFALSLLCSKLYIYCPHFINPLFSDLLAHIIYWWKLSPFNQQFMVRKDFCFWAFEIFRDAFEVVNVACSSVFVAEREISHIQTHDCPVPNNVTKTFMKWPDAFGMPFPSWVILISVQLRCMGMVRPEVKARWGTRKRINLIY